MKRAFLAALFAAILLQSIGHTQISKPNPEQLKADAKRLDQLQKVFTSRPQFGDQFGRDSKRLADERGPEIIHAIMVRGRAWPGEEGLIFEPLVALLPRAPTLKLLKQYEHSKRESDGIRAREMQTEFEASDTQEAVPKYSKPR